MLKKILKNCSVLLPVFFALAILGASAAKAQTTEFTYQGRLVDGSLPANSNYDFEFRLLAADSGGAAIATQQRLGVTVTNGIFSVRLDFGTQFPSAQRWLEIAVKHAGGMSFTTLLPRQPVTSSPYNIRSLNSTNADNATTADTAANSLQLGGIAAGQYVLTDDLRLSDERMPLAGSNNYIQNSNSAQTGVNFNVGGNGTVGGTLSANVLNASTQFNLGGFRILSADSPKFSTFVGFSAGTSSTGFNNSFFGNNAGQANTTGGSNSFFGKDTGLANISGTSNSFFGSFSGQNNTTGNSNSFFGTFAGRGNTTGINNSFFGIQAGVNNNGGSNSFFGAAAGMGNTTGSANTFIGTSSGQSNTTENFNTFIGFNANGTAGINNATAIGANSVVTTSNTMVLGTNIVTVQVPGSLNVAGTFGANILDATTQFNISGNRVLSAAGNFNIFAGIGAGQANTTGTNNSFFGSNTGLNNTTGGSNSFFGSGAGRLNTTGGNNSFFGDGAGANNTTGFNNVFFGQVAGIGNTTGSRNTFVGVLTGTSNTVEDFNTFIGFGANGVAGITRSTAIGADAEVTTSNTIALGTSSDNVIIPGALNISGNGTSGGTLSGSILNAATQFNLGGSRILGIDGTNNLFAGVGAGAGNTGGSYNSFFGRSAGFSNTNGANNSFFGAFAGFSNTEGINNSFFGRSAGSANIIGSNNAFFGEQAGQNSTGDNNAFFGVFAGINNTAGLSNTFVGSGAGTSNTTESGNTFIGAGANGAAGINNATAIGANSSVTTSNTIVLGTNAVTVQVPGSLNVAGTFGANIFNAATQYNIGGSRVIGTVGLGNFFAGVNSGAVNAGLNNTFVGRDTGAANTTGGSNSFFGNGAGGSNNSGGSNAFFGTSTGFSNTTGAGNTFIGAGAGASNTTENNNTFIGRNTNGAAGITNSTAIGANATVGSSNTIVLGNNANVDIPGGSLYVRSSITLGALGGGFPGNQTLCYNNFAAFNYVLSFCSSSLRYKTDVQNFTDGLELIRRLRPVSFNWKQSGERDLGFVAEEVNAVEPLMTTYNSKGEIEGVKYDRISVALVNAVNEQQTQIKQQNEEIRAQEELIQKQQRQLESQQSQIDALKKLICQTNSQAVICTEEQK